MFGRYLLRTGVAVAATFALVIAAIVAVDPLGDFDTEIGDLRTFEYSPLVTANLARKLRTGRFILVFGTSRVRLLSRRYLGKDTLNFHVLYGNPRAILGFLEGLKPIQARNVSRIYVLLDLHTLGPNAYLPPADYGSTAGRYLYRVERIETYLRAGVSKLWRNATGRFEHYVHPRGYTVPINDRGNLCDLPFKGAKLVAPGQAELEALTAIEAYGKRHGIPIVFFSAPVSDKFYATIDKGALTKWRRAVASSVSGYHDLLVASGISDDCSLWADTIHLNGKGTTLMLNAMTSDRYYRSARKFNGGN